MWCSSRVRLMTITAMLCSVAACSLCPLPRVARAPWQWSDGCRDGAQTPLRARVSKAGIRVNDAFRPVLAAWASGKTLAHHISQNFGARQIGGNGCTERSIVHAIAHK